MGFRGKDQAFALYATRHGRGKHPEAFCIMIYTCEGCGKQEELFNTRDGKTPFMVRCIDCGEYMVHKDWSKDKRNWQFKPPKGMRVFVDEIEGNSETVKIITVEE